MNRNNFLGHLALATAIILLAAFAGQVNRWRRDWRSGRNRAVVSRSDEFATQVIKKKGAEILVRFKPGTTLDYIKGIASAHHDQVQDEIESVDGLAVIEDEDGLEADAVANEYRNLSGVEYAEPNLEISLSDPFIGPVLSGSEPGLGLELSGNIPNDPMFANQWSLKNDGQNGGRQGADISALSAWDKTKGSETIVVAVLDSGVDYTHRDLIQNMWVRPAGMTAYSDRELGTIDDTHGFNAVDNLRDPMDDNGHGTHCAGIIGAEGGNDFGITGVNWNVQIMPLKFMNSFGSGTTKDAIECINYVIDRKNAGVNVRVISASWGSTQKSKALSDAIKTAGDNGILFVAAAGNSSSNSDRSPHYPAGYDLPNVISVAATDRNDQLASFSNYGAKSVHVAAPGREILSTWLNGDFREASGTSMATPEVAGVAALVLSLEPDISVQNLKARLLKSVDKLPALEGKVVSGGRISAAKAVGAN
jgi:subtilisin family serine protease